MNDLRIDIEALHSDDECSRPLTDVLLHESEDKNFIDKQFERIQSLFPIMDKMGVKTNRKNRILYTVFVFKIDEEESPEFYEEIDLAQFTSLEKAKRLRNEIIEHEAKQ